MFRKKYCRKNYRTESTTLSCSLKNDPSYGLASRICLLKRPVAQTIKINISLIFRTLDVIEKEPHPY
jgi:hypothetical protein